MRFHAHFRVFIAFVTVLMMIYHMVAVNTGLAGLVKYGVMGGADWLHS